MDCPAIIFLVFNRPEQTRRVFERIRAARPKKLLVAADGPRANNANDVLRCAEVRSIFENIDWECDVTRAFSDVNKGCARAVSESITYGMGLFGEAIILEDDCLPDASFFGYCAELLNRYRDDAGVMCISGDNFQQGHIRGDGSYYFSKYPHCWGWATWKSAWDHFDLSMRGWGEFVQSQAFVDLCPISEEQGFWTRLFEKCDDGRLNTWDIPWVFSCWRSGGRTVLPNCNLVENIGFASDATHTSDSAEKFKTPTASLSGIKHPSRSIIDAEADEFTFRFHYRPVVPKLTMYQEARIRLGAIKQGIVHRLRAFDNK